MSSEARRLALGGLPDWEIELEQMKREIRDLKAQEAKTKWELMRQEKKDVAVHKKEAAAQLMDWRLDQRRAFKELVGSLATGPGAGV